MLAQTPKRWEHGDIAHEQKDDVHREEDPKDVGTLTQRNLEQQHQTGKTAVNERRAVGHAGLFGHQRKGTRHVAMARGIARYVVDAKAPADHIGEQRHQKGHAHDHRQRVGAPHHSGDCVHNARIE